MALTAQPQSALPTRNGWDDEIVPTLRKRLETESRMLANRMSISRDEQYDYRAAEYDNSATSASPSPSPDTTDGLYPNGSRIPRPSLSGRPADTSAMDATAATASAAATASYQSQRPTKRARTQSTPFVDTSVLVAQAASPPPGSTPSRIPVARGRSPSFSSNTRLADASYSTTASQPRAPSPLGVSIQALNHKPSYIPAEPAPFPGSSGPGSYSSSLAGTRTPISSSAPLSPAAASMSQPRSAGAVTTFNNSSRYSPRMSTESEERPFEHWYRGDTARNGGVGELRVGRKQEMLDIASYGHRVMQQGQGQNRERDNRPQPSPRTSSYARRRADSVGARDSLGNRGSLYLEDEEEDGGAGQGGQGRRPRVLDEAPLTDVDATPSEDEGLGYDPYDHYYEEEDTTQSYGHSNSQSKGYYDEPQEIAQPVVVAPTPSTSSSKPPAKKASPSPRPGSAKKTNPAAKSTASLVAASPSQVSKKTASTGTTGSTRTNGTTGKTTPTPGSTSRLTRPGAPTSPAASTSSLHTPRKGTAASAAGPSTPNRGRGGTPRGGANRGAGAAAARPGGAKRTMSAGVKDKENDRRSVGVYPSPSSAAGGLNGHGGDASTSFASGARNSDGGDDSLADAIPTWTQPVASATGNWDEVVLPTVARKKGLDAHYAQADGSPKPSKSGQSGQTANGDGEEAYEPAPGTFGYDWTKYQPPRTGETDELGFGPSSSKLGTDTEDGAKNGMQWSDSKQPLVGAANGDGEFDPYAEARDDAATPTPQPKPKPIYPPQAQSPVEQGYPRQPTSPGPFASYGADVQNVTSNGRPQGQGQMQGQMPMETLPRPAAAAPPPTVSKFEDEDIKGGGCCKCVIM